MGGSDPPHVVDRTAHMWLLPAAVAILRALPYLYALRASAPAGEEFVPVGYVPKDLVQYLAFARQATEAGRWLFDNPFTTDPQSGRFVCPLFSLQGVVSALTGAPLHVVFELS